MTLWQYGEDVRAIWTAAESELSRAARWLVLILVAQALTLANVNKFKQGAKPRKFNVLDLDMSVPGYLIGLGLAVAAGYWVSQYVYASLCASTAVKFHEAVVVRLVGSRNADRFREPLTPPHSIAGRPPTQRPIPKYLSAWMGRWGGVVLVVLMLVFEAFIFWRFFPGWGAEKKWWTAWVISLGVTALWIGFSCTYLPRKKETRDSEAEDIDKMLDRLQSTRVLGP